MSNRNLLPPQLQEKLSTVLNEANLAEYKKQQLGKLKRNKDKILPAVCLLVLVMLHLWLLSTMQPSLPTADGFSDAKFFLIEDHIISEEHAFSTQHPTMIPIFYDLFIKNNSDIPRVSYFMREQLESYMKPVHGPVFINSLGAVNDLKKLNLPAAINATLHHYEQGDEEITLQDLWAYCSRDDTHPKQKVAYLHSKGSFHQHDANDRLRVYLTKGALSSECSSMPDTCNVCSSRMSPMPYPHTSGTGENCYQTQELEVRITTLHWCSCLLKFHSTGHPTHTLSFFYVPCKSGNMWMARCDYVRKLFEPKSFKDAMYTTSKELLGNESACMGTGRYAMEHWWVLSAAAYLWQCNPLYALNILTALPFLM